MVTTIEPVCAPSAGLGVALTSTRTLRPSGTDTSISSARTVSGCANCSASGASRPSARRTTTTSSRSSSRLPGSRRLSTMRRASRFVDISRPPPSKTTTPTGDVSISASRSCRCAPLAVVGPPLGRVGARVADRGRRLRREQLQHLLVGVRERGAARLLAEEQVADAGVAVPHPRALERAWDQRRRREVQFALHVRRQVVHPERPRQLVQVLEQRQPGGPFHQLALLGGLEPGEDVVDGHPGLVHGGEDPEPRPRQAARPLDDLAQHRVEVEARADAQDRRRQRGRAVARVTVFRSAIPTARRVPSPCAPSDCQPNTDAAFTITKPAGGGAQTECGRGRPRTSRCSACGGARTSPSAIGFARGPECGRGRPRTFAVFGVRRCADVPVRNWTSHGCRNADEDVRAPPGVRREGVRGRPRPQLACAGPECGRGRPRTSRCSACGGARTSPSAIGLRGTGMRTRTSAHLPVFGVRRVRGTSPSAIGFARCRNADEDVRAPPGVRRVAVRGRPRPQLT